MNCVRHNGEHGRLEGSEDGAAITIAKMADEVVIINETVCYIIHNMNSQLVIS